MVLEVAPFPRDGGGAAPLIFSLCSAVAACLRLQLLAFRRFCAAAAPSLFPPQAACPISLALRPAACCCCLSVGFPQSRDSDERHLPSIRGHYFASAPPSTSRLDHHDHLTRPHFADAHHLSFTMTKNRHCIGKERRGGRTAVIRGSSSHSTSRERTDGRYGAYTLGPYAVATPNFSLTHLSTLLISSPCP